MTEQQESVNEVVTEKNKAKLVVLCAGGTGGHFFPAKALSEDLISRGFQVKFFGDTRGRKYKDQLSEEISYHEIASAAMKAGIMGKIRGVFMLLLGMVQSFIHYIAHRPAVVVGFGGYPSFPSVMMAQILFIPTIIHEQNAVVGRANRQLSRGAKKIALSLPDIDGLSEKAKQRAIVTGNPVRQDIADLYTQPYTPSDEDGEFNLYVFAGSQGARSFSQIVPEAIVALPDELKARLNITQQALEEDMMKVIDIYDKAKIKAEIKPFFSDVKEILSKAHLVIARGGASTVAEITTAGRPAIFVPYPHHKDHQQKMNALSIADHHGGWVLEEGTEFTAENLERRLEMLMNDPEKLFKTAEAARDCATPDAARKLGSLVTSVAKGWKPKNVVQKTSNSSETGTENSDGGEG